MTETNPSSNPIRVVIIGASVAGSPVALKLVQSFTNSQVHVTVIDKRGYYYYTPASVRALVDKDMAPNVFVPLDHLFDGAKYDKSSHPHHQLIHGTVSRVETGHVYVEETETSYPYDYLVVATGTVFNSPYHHDQETDKTKWVARAHGFTDKLREAKRVVVVGGGATGVETAGDIKHAFPDKHVTLVHNGDLLLTPDSPDKFRQRLTRRTKEFGIDLILGDKLNFDPTTDVASSETPLPLTLQTYTTAKGKSLEADFVISAIGGRVYTEFMAPLLVSVAGDRDDPSAGGELVVAGKGTLRVLPTLQMAHDRLAHVFVVGDANDFPCVKTAFRSGFQGGVAAQNLVALIKQRLTGSTKPIKLAPYKDSLNAMLVTLGPKAGVALLPFGIMAGDWVVSKVKGADMLLGKAWGGVGATYPK
ncbi:hypothetical protein BJ085DRAFT_20624 [Dimargaris cristalligena]|uniref:FAD/NAD(P)-binding domain-containing protein n=1 Tax=Dimargaris cristalligena TaxID=215637 RepID=A0A4P9ZZG4_9FUNG|nr:hypothetical protein BJ085DRAFT_20624 [Dimargaris cristalligena]|eukprot:RKP39174.1 hypothetical protein BJ085DRAFT_20624 [Dimargaris cristalligena]